MNSFLYRLPLRLRLDQVILLQATSAPSIGSDHKTHLSKTRLRVFEKHDSQSKKNAVPQAGVLIYTYVKSKKQNAQKNQNAKKPKKQQQQQQSEYEATAQKHNTTTTKHQKHQKRKANHLARRFEAHTLN